MKEIIFILLGILLLGCSSEEVEVPTPGQNLSSFSLLSRSIGDQDLVIAGSKEFCIGTSFYKMLDGELLEFVPVKQKLPYIMEDQYGRMWDMFGRSNQTSSRLTPVTSSFGYWFGWSAVFPGIDLFNTSPPIPDRIPTGGQEWSIPYEYVFTGANFDVIEGLVYPEFIVYNQKDDIKNGFFLEDNDQVIAIPDNNSVRIYPHKILNYHEIVNDLVEGKDIAIIYSPFTSTSIVWDRNVNGRIETFGSSGMIYNNNILPFDRRTQSIWSQLLGECVSGFYRGARPGLIPHIETKWKVIKELFEKPLVLSPDTGFDFDYQEYPFEDYRTNHEYLYANNLFYSDSRLKRKEIVFGVAVENEAIAYKLEDF
jgi:hypothetical protein